MKLFSYMVKDDAGCSPNPFWGCCTLANGIPLIRRKAEAGDWIVGLVSNDGGYGVIYAMEVDEVIPYEQYFRESRFFGKIPDYTKDEAVCRCGDNIYKPMRGGGFRQLLSIYCDGLSQNVGKTKHDLSGRNVLVARRFYYFGSEPVRLPENLGVLGVRRGYKSRFSKEVVSAFIRFISSRTPGVNAPPTSWPRDDESWKAAQ